MTPSRTLALAAILFSAITARGQICSNSWDATGYPLGGLAAMGNNGASIYAQVVHDDGTGPAFYVAGTFAGIDGVPAACIAKWNGTSWSPLGTGIGAVSPAPIVGALASFDDGTGRALYAAGRFSTAGGVACSNIARWKNGAWSSVGGGTNNGVAALLAYENGPLHFLFAGGDFTAVGAALPASRIAAWDGASWFAFGAIDGPVATLTRFDDGNGDALFVGGTFTYAGGVLSPNVARYGNGAWTAPGGGLPNYGTSIACLGAFDFGSGPELVAGGTFILPPPGPGVIRLHAGAWVNVGSGLTNNIFAIAVHDFGSGPTLCAALSPQGVGCTSTNGCGVHRWNGSSWQLLGPAWSGGGITQVRTLLSRSGPSGPVLTAGGGVLGVPGDLLPGIVEWKGAYFGPMSPAISAPVQTATTFDDGAGEKLVVGGAFSFAGGIAANGIVSRSAGTWIPLGGGLTDLGGPAQALALTKFDFGSGPELVAGGTFTAAGGVPAARVARWNGTTWAAIGAGFGATVRALAVHDDGAGPRLYAAGDFTNSGGFPINRVARWNGSAWVPLAGGVGGQVNALASANLGQGARLYAAGAFTNAGGFTAARIAQWDGSAWTSLGINSGPNPSGLDGMVNALLPVDLDGPGGAPLRLIAGGVFTVATSNGVGVGVSRIAAWTGTAWQPLGGGLFTTFGAPEVDALAVFDDGTGPALYAAGVLTVAGPSTPLTNIGRWDGTAWANVAGGFTGGPVRMLAATGLADGPALYAGGDFSAAGGSPAGYFARLVAPGAIGFAPAPPAAVSVTSGQPVTLTVSPTGIGSIFCQWRKDGSLISAINTSYTIPSATWTDGGTYTVDCSNPCNTRVSPPIALFVRTSSLALSIPAGPGSLLVATSGGLPGASCFTAFSVDLLNASQPGSGWLGGLQIAYDFAIFQFSLQAPPFVRTLNGSGASTFTFPAGTTPPSLSGMTLWAVSVTYDPMTLAPTGLSTIPSVVLL